MSYVSPGVYSKVIDLSFYVRNVPSTIGFIAIVSEKGRDNELVFTNAKAFYEEFGPPNINFGAQPYGQGKYVCDSFLKNSDSLYVIRVMSDNSTYSSLGLLGETDGNYGVDSTSTVFAIPVTNLNTEKEIETVVSDTGYSLLPAGYNTGDYNCAVIFTGRGRGEWYDGFKISVSPHANTVRAAEGFYMLDIWKKQIAQDYDNDLGQWVDAYEIAQTFEVSFNPAKTDTAGESAFIEDVVNKYFSELVVYSNRDLCQEMEDSGTDWSLAFLDGAVQLGGGSGDQDTINGADQLLAQAYIGQLSRAKANKDGYDSTMYVTEVLDTEDIYFTIVLDGGYSANVKQSIYTLCRDLRKDCVGILDNGDSKSVDEALRNRRYTHTYNTYHVAMYESYSQIYDVFTGRDIWITPVYHLASIIPYTDNVAELWYAPAGFNRATLPAIKKLRFSPRLSERELMYLEQLNPIVKFNPGYTVWGQLTSQKRPTALQDLNITRLVLYIKRALEQYCKFFVFEMNDAETWTAVRDGIDKFLKVIQDKRGLYGFSVSVGATEYEIKAKQMHVDVTLNPTRVVEQISLNFFII